MQKWLAALTSNSDLATHWSAASAQADVSAPVTTAILRCTQPLRGRRWRCCPEQRRRQRLSGQTLPGPAWSPSLAWGAAVAARDSRRRAAPAAAVVSRGRRARLAPLQPWGPARRLRRSSSPGAALLCGEAEDGIAPLLLTASARTLCGLSGSRCTAGPRHARLCRAFAARAPV